MPATIQAMKTRREFRDYLNQTYPAPTHRNGRFHQKTRPYGDYLWFQDREKFEVEYAEWLKTPTTTED